MKKIFEKWWNNDNKCFSIRNYKVSWKEVGNKPRIDFWTNGAKKGQDSCLDVTLILGYTIFNYINFNYSKPTKWRRWLNALKRWRTQEQCYGRMEYNNKAAMGCCSGLCASNKVSSFLYPCADERGIVMRYAYNTKLLRCPECERKFGGTDKIIVRGGLARCPNCEAELKTIQAGLNTDLVIVDETYSLKGDDNNG